MEQSEIHVKIKSNSIKERIQALNEISNNFATVSNKVQALEDITQLTQDEDNYVRWLAVTVLRNVFDYYLYKESIEKYNMRIRIDNIQKYSTLTRTIPHFGAYTQIEPFKSHDMDYNFPVSILGVRQNDPQYEKEGIKKIMNVFEAAIWITIGIIGGAIAPYLIGKMVKQKASCPICDRKITKGPDNISKCSSCQTELRWI